MNKINELRDFLNSIKETLPFKDEKDFKRQIKESKEFRIKVQKLVYLSKFFGWDNSYHFNFHEHGPYSLQLSEDYYNINSFKNLTQEIELEDGFKDFIKNKNKEFLEAASTILYYFSKMHPESIEKNEIMVILNHLKPQIPKKIIEDSYDTMKNYGLFNSDLSNPKIQLKKEMVLDKLEGLMSIFENFEDCSNQLLLLGSLNYFRLALNKEKLEKHQQEELLQTIYDYGEYMENYYFNNYSLKDDLPHCDLSELNSKFDELQNNIHDLGILPRLYDEDVDLNIFCE